jgi:hypothetical protein
MKPTSRCALALVVLMVGAASTQAAQAQSSRNAREANRIEELGEVVVTGEKATRKVADLIPWLRRLLGQYSYNGWVDLGGQGNPEDRRPVRGVGLCMGFGVAPGVQCEINVRWPQVKGPAGEEVMGGVSTLDPAMILYGLEPDEIGIRYLQVDNTGLAEGATGTIIGNTATFTAPCADIPGNCRRITQITADSDSKIVDMQIDTELDYVLAMRFRFQMTRIGTVQAPEAP